MVASFFVRRRADFIASCAILYSLRSGRSTERNRLASTLNNLLAHFDLHLSRASSFQGLRSELARRQEQVDDLAATLRRLTDDQECEKLKKLSQVRWRSEEPDPGLTWGVPMVGDEFVRFLLKHVTLDDTS